MLMENYKCDGCGFCFSADYKKSNMVCSVCGSTSSTVRKFVCIRKTDMKDLELAVNDYLEAGYKICGGVCRSEDDHNVFYVVGMIKKN